MVGRTRALTLPVAVALLLGACGASVASPAPATVPASAPPSAAPASAAPGSAAPSPAAAAPGLLLDVTTEGGFINPAANIGSLPRLVVETDGAIYLPDSSATPSVAPAVTVRNVGAAGAAAIAEAIRAAGLTTEGTGGVAADTGRTVFTVDVGGSEIVSSYASGGPGGGVGGPGGSVGGQGRPGTSPGASGPGVSGPGAAAFDLLARLEDPAVAWAGTTGSPAAYAPAGYRVFVAPSGGAAGATGVPWPLAGDPAAFGAPAAVDLGVAGLRSGVVLAADAGPLAPVLAAAPGTVLTAGGRAWSVWVRPLFPFELGA